MTWTIVLHTPAGAGVDESLRHAVDPLCGRGVTCAMDIRAQNSYFCAYSSLYERIL